MLRYKLFSVALCICVSEGHAFLEMARFFVCLVTVVFVRCCRRLDSVIEWTMYSACELLASSSQTRVVLIQNCPTTGTSSKQEAELDD